jgi:hypothetical protein
VIDKFIAALSLSPTLSLTLALKIRKILVKYEAMSTVARNTAHNLLARQRSKQWPRRQKRLRPTP